VQIEKQNMLEQFNQYMLAETNVLLPHWGDYTEVESLFNKNRLSIHLVCKHSSDKLFLLKEFYTNDISSCREAAMMSDLCHSGIPKVVDQFIENEHVILVREYIQGQSLETLLKAKGCLSEKVSLDILLQLCDIVKYLHSRQPYPLIHRDIKPANIILDEQNKVWLIDFDSAREYKPHASSDTQYFGTQGYAAPEQYGFSQTDRRTDIFSMGTLLFFMLTGRHLDDVKGSTDNRIKNGFISSGLFWIINKCNRFDPNRRYRSVEDLVQALKFYQKRIGIRITTAAAISLLCMLALLLYQQILSQPASGVEQSSITEEIAAGSLQEALSSETSAAAIDTLTETAAVESLPDTITNEILPDTISDKPLLDNTLIETTVSISESNTASGAEQLPGEKASLPTTETLFHGTIPYPEGLAYGTLLRSSSPLHLSSVSQIGTTGDGGPDWDFDGKVEVYTFIHWLEKMELHIGWRDQMEVFNLYEAIPKVGLNDDGSPKIGYMMELSCMDLDDDGILEMIVAMGNLENEMGISLVHMDAKLQSFHVSEDRLIGGRFMYLDDDMRVVVPSNDHNTGGIYSYRNGRLVLQ